MYQAAHSFPRQPTSGAKGFSGRKWFSEVINQLRWELLASTSSLFFRNEKWEKEKNHFDESGILWAENKPKFVLNILSTTKLLYHGEYNSRNISRMSETHLP